MGATVTLDTTKMSVKTTVHVDIKTCKENAVLPKYQTSGASGMDLCAAIDAPVKIEPLERTLIPTGLQIALPEGFEAQLRPRSGLSIKKGISLVNCVGTIDSDYRGEICIPVINLSKETYEIKPNERIAQMVVAPYVSVVWEEVEELSETVRGEGGFGSTGRN